MIKQLKIILSHIKLFFIFSIPLVSCLDLDVKYLKNKIIIKSFTLEKTKSFLTLKFNIDYYSDSTNANYYAESIEKGQDGIDGKVIFFGSLSEKFTYDESCQYYKFKDITERINEQKYCFIGEKIERYYHKVCMPLNLNLIDSNIVLIIQNNNSYDTIFNSPPLDTLFENNVEVKKHFFSN